MKKILPLILLLTGIAVVGFNYEKKEKPNVLFIIADDLRPELGTFGAAHIKSPNIDKLAENSAVFERAFCNIPVCGASRASLFQV